MAAISTIETAPGVRCGRILRGIRRVGLYVPAGSAPLPSTALMLGVPARWLVAARSCCARRRAPTAAPIPRVLAAARLCGIAVCSSSAARRRSRRWPSAPSRCPPATSCSARATAASPRPSSRFRRMPRRSGHRHAGRAFRSAGDRRRRRHPRVRRRRPAVAGRTRPRFAGDAGRRRRRTARCGVREQSNASCRRCRAPTIARQALAHARLIVRRHARRGIRDQQRLRARAPDPGRCATARAGCRRVQLRGLGVPRRLRAAKRWATTARAPTTCCRPMAPRAPGAAWRCQFPDQHQPCRRSAARASPRSARARSRWRAPKAWRRMRGGAAAPGGTAHEPGPRPAARRTCATSPATPRRAAHAGRRSIWLNANESPLAVARRSGGSA